MALTPSTTINNGGIYRILSVNALYADVDLLAPGGANGTIGGYSNDPSKRNKWLATEVGNQQVTFTNQEITTYANVLQTNINEQLVGNPDVPVVWSWTLSSGSKDEFILYKENTGNAWTLTDGHDGTPVILASVINPFFTPPSQRWIFVRLN